MQVHHGSRSIPTRDRLFTVIMHSTDWLLNYKVDDDNSLAEYRLKKDMYRFAVDNKLVTTREVPGKASHPLSLRLGW